MTEPFLQQILSSLLTHVELKEVTKEDGSTYLTVHHHQSPGDEFSSVYADILNSVREARDRGEKVSPILYPQEMGTTSGGRVCRLALKNVADGGKTMRVNLLVTTEPWKVRLWVCLVNQLLLDNRELDSRLGLTG